MTKTTPHTNRGPALSHLLRVAAALALAATSACIQLEADLPEICKTAEITYTAPQSALKSGAAAGGLEQTVEFLPAGLSEVLTELKLTSGAVSITPAGAVDELKMILRPADGSTEFDLALLHMKPVGAGGPVPDLQADLLPYLGGTLVFQVAGSPPDGTKFFVAVCASAKAAKEFKLTNH
jgi:hypothetical protein